MAQRAALAPLTSLRFFAAALVVCHHCFDFKLGYAGVTFFFVLSGFILAYNYAGKIEGSADRLDFWRRRFARIYPAHLLTLLGAAPIALYGIAKSGLDAATIATQAVAFASNLFLLQSWIPVREVYFGLNSVSWSISDEAFFYAVFPLLLGVFHKVGLRISWLIVAAFCLATLAFAAVWSILHPGAPIEHPGTHYIFYINPVTRLCEFAVGMVMGLGFLTNKRALGLASEVGAIAFVILTFVAAGSAAIPSSIVVSLFFLPASCVVVGVFARGQGALSRALHNPALILLGEASFMLYMVHQLIGRYLVLVLGEGLTNGIVTAVLSVISAVVLHRLFERPMNRRLLPKPALA